MPPPPLPPQVKFPPYLSPAACDLITRLLERRPTRRLGMLAGGCACVCVVAKLACMASEWLNPVTLPVVVLHVVRAGRAADVKRHRWFDGFEWEGLAARRLPPPRAPRDDAAKRLRELAVSERACGLWVFVCLGGQE